MPSDESFFDPSPSSVITSEVERFSSLADQWWDPRGPMRPLHAMNDTRLKWISKNFIKHRQNGHAINSVLDLGCGAGLASEGMARMGYNILGVDASEKAIAAAQHHILNFPMDKRSGQLSYRAGSAENLLAEGITFDAILALEIIEHVADPAAFMKLLYRLLNPNGIMVISTLNRTWQSMLIAKIGAEYVLHLLPVGTHEWKKFITPTELGQFANEAGLRITNITGIAPAPTGRWHTTPSMKVNYIAALQNN